MADCLLKWSHVALPTSRACYGVGKAKMPDDYAICQLTCTWHPTAQMYIIGQHPATSLQGSVPLELTPVDMAVPFGYMSHSIAHDPEHAFVNAQPDDFFHVQACVGVDSKAQFGTV